MNEKEVLNTEEITPEMFIENVKNGKITPEKYTTEEMIQLGIKTLFNNSKLCKDGSLNFENDKKRMEWAIKRFKHLSDKLIKRGKPIVCDICKKSSSNITTGPLRKTISNKYIHQSCISI